MSKTIHQKLVRTADLLSGPSWYVNPKEHPYPTLPDMDYLRGEYLQQLAACAPGVVAEAIVILDLIGQGSLEEDSGV